MLVQFGSGVRPTGRKSDLRSQAKAFYNCLDVSKPVNFGVTDLLERGVDEKFYVTQLHGRDHEDPVQELADQIDFSDSAGTYLFTGNRGTGKTTELLRLAKILRRDEYNCEVFYVDIAEYLYLYLSDPIEVSDFPIAVMGGLSEKFRERFKEDPGREGYLERVFKFLRTEVQLTELKASMGAADFKLAFQENPTFKQELQRKTRGFVEKLVQQARQFALELKKQIALLKSDEQRKVVLIVDSFERVGGNYSNEKDVFASVATLFSAQADKLRFQGISIVYTVPPYVSGLWGGIGAHYDSGRIYALPSVHIYKCCPEAGVRPEPYADGIGKMTAIVRKRYSGWEKFFTSSQLDRLAQNSGGDLRDYFRLHRATSRSRSIISERSSVIWAQCRRRGKPLERASNSADSFA